ncbi:CotH protein [Gimesia alba]|uniref:CotH protein n=1 Tax=Gimesia alba TaxID=2527973 RepID=A0A517RD15_9PLAN|nr:CotH kinase family protein [Gimesia alba]QDT41724.1 CotH protein [Gimesia alba]
MQRSFQTILCYLFAVTAFTAFVHAQPPGPQTQSAPSTFPPGPFQGAPPFSSGSGSERRPGPGGPGAEERKLVDQFDLNQNGQLDKNERTKARQFLKDNPVRRGGPGGFGPPRPDSRRTDTNNRRHRRGPAGPMNHSRSTPRPGKKISPDDVPVINADLYTPFVLRTIFINFENKDWEAELEDFHGTDVEVPATLIVDRKEYPGCGIHFRGMSSYMMVPAGYKRSLNVSLDFTNEEQRLLGAKTLNLLNCNGDDSLLSTVLYSHIARKHMPAPKANLVRVVINGENWGIFTNVQQFNKDFLKENYPSAKGTRWKVSGSPRGGGGLDYRGESPELYGYPYEMKNGDEKSLKKLIEFCRILNQTPASELESALTDKVDMNELLWFLALDNALCNSDGYWIRASDYSIFLDKQDRFHFFPHDMNEAFRFVRGGPGFGPPGGPPGRFRERRAGTGSRGAGPPDGFGPPGPSGGPPRGFPAQPGFDPRHANGKQNEGGQLDPLIGLDDSQKPLRSKILAVPNLRASYLQKIRMIAEDLDWNELGPVVDQYRQLLLKEVKQDTRKLGSYENFLKLTANRIPRSTTGGHGPGGHGAVNLHQFARERREYLLKVTPKE